MCAVSMIGDHYNDKWRERDWFPNVPTWPNQFPPPAPADLGVSKAEFDALKAEVAELKLLLQRAKPVLQPFDLIECRCRGHDGIQGRMSRLIIRLLGRGESRELTCSSGVKSLEVSRWLTPPPA